MGNQEQLKTMSETDGLTGLLNRRTFIDRLSARLETDAGCGVLAYVDLDNFKSVNDLAGHAEGDAVLTTLSDALDDMCGDKDIAARLGGDEFVLWLEGIPRDKSQEAGETVLERCAAIKGFTVDPAKPVGVSVGIAPWVPESGDAVDSLMARADHAMYEVKHGTKGAVAVADIDVVIDDNGAVTDEFWEPQSIIWPREKGRRLQRCEARGGIRYGKSPAGYRNAQRYPKGNSLLPGR